MYDDFTKAFCNGPLREHQEKILLEREKAILPQTQADLYVKGCCKLYGELRAAASTAKKTGRTENLASIQVCMQNLVNEVGEATLLSRNFSQPSDKKNNFTAICHCPKEGCRGFIQKLNHACGLCGTTVCRKCRVVKTADHACKKEDVDTANELAKNTKACPKCAALIFKIDGCSQMWCVMCQTAFNWRTGEIETKIHNPHYYEWLRRNGRHIPREEGDNPCGDNGLRLASFANFSQQINLRNQKLSSSSFDYLYKLYQKLVHLEYMLPGDMRQRLAPQDDTNYNLRVDYLQGVITEKDWAKRLITADRKQERMVALRNIYDVFMSATRDLINGLRQHTTLEDVHITTLNMEVETLREYCNGCFERIAKCYNATPFCINKSIEIVRQRPALKAVQ